MNTVVCRILNRRHYLSVAIAAIVTGCCLLSGTANAAEESRAILKSYFETGDVPTEQEFADLIDSFISRIDDGVYIGAPPDPVGQGVLSGIGTEIGGPGTFFAPVKGLGEDWVGQSGFLGISLELDLQTHYGYLQITSPPGDQYPMFVEAIVIQTDPNTPIVASHVPEPSTLALLAIGSLALMRTRRRAG